MPPETGNYLLLALAAATLILGALLASLIARNRNLDRDLELIEQLSEADK